MHFCRTHNDEVPLALDGDLDERVAGHVLDALVRLVHEFEQLVDHLQFIFKIFFSSGFFF